MATFARLCSCVILYLMLYEYLSDAGVYGADVNSLLIRRTVLALMMNNTDRAGAVPGHIMLRMF